MRTAVLLLTLFALAVASSAEEEKAAPAPSPASDLEKALASGKAARDRGLAWLRAHPKEDGSWGGVYSIAVTSYACLAHLAATDDPFTGPGSAELARGIAFLLAHQKEGLFPQQGHTWIHVQGFGTLALAEAYGRALLAREKPDLDLEKLRGVLAKAVRAIEENQSTSGGWWYRRGNPGAHEGSTTVTAVQALVSARNFGIEIDGKVLAKGFEYLKRCQNKDGGFDYKEGPGETSMKEGTAADVATLALMKKFDYSVMMNGYQFLVRIGPGVISAERFPYYGHFYGLMGMRLLLEEFPPFAPKIDAYVAGAIRDVVSWQCEDGSWPLKRWVKDQRQETPAYSTAFAALLLSVPEGRLSIFRRKPPKLPE